MSRHTAILLAWFAFAVPALAQQPPTGGSLLPPPGAGDNRPANLVPVLDPNNRLDSLLMAWEKNMTSVDSIYVQKLQRTEKDKTGTKVYEGEARYMRPNLAALRLVQQANPNLYELFICTGNFLYEYRPQSRKLMIHELDQPKAGNFNNSFMQFLFGMSAVDAKRRYELTLAKDLSAENPHYVYIDIKPRFEGDKREFTRAQMVLFGATMLPRRLWFEHRNGNEILWDIPNLDTQVKLKQADFTPPQAPQGWETVRVPRGDTVLPTGGEKPPRIVRPGSDK